MGALYASSPRSPQIHMPNREFDTSLSITLACEPFTSTMPCASPTAPVCHAPFVTTGLFQIRLWSPLATPIPNWYPSR